MQTKRDNYDKGNTRTIDERKEELLFWLDSCNIQRPDGRGYRYQAKFAGACRIEQGRGCTEQKGLYQGW